MIDRYIDPDDDFYSRKECRCCLEKEQKMDEASEYLREIVKQLYSKEILDASALEFCLDELCHHLGVKSIPGDLTIQRKVEQPVRTIPYWLNFIHKEMAQHQHIEKIA